MKYVLAVLVWLPLIFISLLAELLIFADFLQRGASGELFVGDYGFSYFVGYALVTLFVMALFLLLIIFSVKKILGAFWPKKKVET